MAFVIQSEFPSAPGVIETKRRYSEFESLAKILARAHPAIVVPPIPEKHAISDYATKTAKVREDPSLLNRRQRQLQTFLNRVAQHPVLSREHIFHQFLVATTTSWTDLLAQSDQSHLLRKQRSGSLRFTDNLKLTDKSTAPLKNPEPRFAAAERYTSQFLEQMQHTYRVQKRIGKQHVDMMQTLAELGHKYNSFSLSLDHHTLGPLLEFFGEAFDKTVPITERFYKAQDASATDTLHEYAQFAQTIEGLLRARHRKQADLEGTVDSIAAKRATLAQLEASEQESQRIAAIVNAEGFRGSGFGTSGTSPHSAGHSSASTTLGGSPYARPVVMGTSYYSGGSLLASINSLLDHDPEASRRNQISKTREKIVQLEAAQARLEVELAETNATLAEDLDRFQAGKVRDIKAMLTTLCRQQITHANEMREVWQAFSLPSCK
ncbi:hypothetical protein CXG81DRAFT_10776 [Caulochytrium protostelioides]|uniref:PX domain-containing protein n=1 Tax=Caulochytrium protostelioides TaxID=1555241 RepID=A0A4P9XAT9_9FUNG|nr:hypothetical protein CXG81DRAFT_10776 [Caulochytrium protostelioides]|eukprot:RKP02455.1 hypothetical protein CXG81DRAFT_10776 [Caulochytrium protostelioides]